MHSNDVSSRHHPLHAPLPPSLQHQVYTLVVYSVLYMSGAPDTGRGLVLEPKQAPVTNSSLSYTHLEGPPSYQITLSDDGARATKY